MRRRLVAGAVSCCINIHYSLIKFNIQKPFHQKNVFFFPLLQHEREPARRLCATTKGATRDWLRSGLSEIYVFDNHEFRPVSVCFVSFFLVHISSLFSCNQNRIHISQTELSDGRRRRRRCTASHSTPDAWRGATWRPSSGRAAATARV